MREVEITKDRLIEKLTENKKTHKADFNIAWEAFRKKAIENATAIVDSLKSAKKGQELRLHINLQPPVDHSADYDRVLSMLEWEERDVIMLEEHDFQQYVQDDWGWKGAFSVSNQLYTGSKSPSRR